MRRRRGLDDARSERERRWWPLLHPDRTVSLPERMRQLREHHARLDAREPEGGGVLIEGVLFGGDDATT